MEATEKKDRFQIRQLEERIAPAILLTNPGGNNPQGDANGKALTVDGSGNTTISGVVSDGKGGAPITKAGSGTLTLSGTNTFGGALTIQSGTLSIATINNASSNGVLGNSATAVTLGGSGTTGTLSYTGATASSTKTFTMATGGTGAFVRSGIGLPGLPFGLNLTSDRS